MRLQLDWMLSIIVINNSTLRTHQCFYYYFIRIPKLMLSIIFGELIYLMISLFIVSGMGVYCDVDESASNNCTCSSWSNSGCCLSIGTGCLKQAEAQLRALCLPFLRVAALLRHHLYNQPLPEIDDPEQEFLRLIYYLELIWEGMSIHRWD